MTFLRTIKIIALVLFLFSVVIAGVHKRQRYSQHRKQYRAPVVITAAEFIRTHPRQGWFRVTGVTTYANEAESLWNDPNDHGDNGDGSGTIDSAFIPAYDETAPHDQKAGVVLLTDHLRIRKVINDMQKLGFKELMPIPNRRFATNESEAPVQPADPANVSKLKNWVLHNADRIRETRTIEGMVRSRDDLELYDAAVYDSVRSKVAPVHVLLEEGITPKTDDDGGGELGLATVLGVIGGTIVLFIISRFIKAWREGEEEVMDPITSMSPPKSKWKQRLEE